MMGIRATSVTGDAETRIYPFPDKRPRRPRQARVLYGRHRRVGIFQSLKRADNRSRQTPAPTRHRTLRPAHGEPRPRGSSDRQDPKHSFQKRKRSRRCGWESRNGKSKSPALRVHVARKRGPFGSRTIRASPTPAPDRIVGQATFLHWSCPLQCNQERILVWPRGPPPKRRESSARRASIALIAQRSQSPCRGGFRRSARRSLRDTSKPEIVAQALSRLVNDAGFPPLTSIQCPKDLHSQIR